MTAADVIALTQLQSRFCHYLALGYAADLIALFAPAPGTRIEIGGVGAYIGVDAAERAFAGYLLRDRHLPGVFSLTMAVNGMFEFSDDGSRARAGWLSPGAETQRGEAGDLEDRWRWGRILTECVRTSDGWLFSSFAYHLTFTARGDWGAIWPLNEQPFPRDPLPFDRPISWHAPYRPDRVVDAGSGLDWPAPARGPA